jgi:predicted Rossmann fold flavoprotein
MIVPFLNKCGIRKEQKPNSLTKEERRIIVETLKSFKVDIHSFRPVDEAIVTSGGVATKEINPSTMESKIINGLYFAGEVIDVDAYTGGFNLQIAFSTARLAGKSVCEE